MHFKVIRSFHRLLLAVEARVNLEVAYRDDGGGRGVSCRCIRCSHERLHVSLRRLQVSLGRLQVSLGRLHVPIRRLQVSVGWLQGDMVEEGVRLLSGVRWEEFAVCTPSFRCFPSPQIRCQPVQCRHAFEFTVAEESAATRKR